MLHLSSFPNLLTIQNCQSNGDLLVNTDRSHADTFTHLLPDNCCASVAWPFPAGDSKKSIRLMEAPTFSNTSTSDTAAVVIENMFHEAFPKTHFGKWEKTPFATRTAIWNACDCVFPSFFYAREFYVSCDPRNLPDDI